MAAAKNIVLVDGGANLLYKSELRETSNIRGIVGDLDSILPEVRSYYEAKGVPVVHVADQDSNDLQKGLALARQRGWLSLVVLGALGGRIDQQLANLHALQLHADSQKDANLLAIGGDSVVCLVKAE